MSIVSSFTPIGAFGDACYSVDCWDKSHAFLLSGLDKVNFKLIIL